MSNLSMANLGTGAIDITTHAYFNAQCVIEERKGSNQFIKDHVWGISYVDEGSPDADYYHIK